MKIEAIAPRVFIVVQNQLFLTKDIASDSPLSSLNLDSLDYLEIVMSLEDEFGVEIEDSGAYVNDANWKWKTVQDIVDYLGTRKDLK